MQRYLILLVLTFFSISLTAQEELDSTSKDCIHLKDLHWIKDSMYGVFMTRRFTNLKPFFFSFKTYQKTIDTSEAGQQSDVTQFVQYNTLWRTLMYKYIKINRKTEKVGIKWEKTSLDSFTIDTAESGDMEYAYIHWFIKYNERRVHHFSAFFLHLGNKWFLLEELNYHGIVITNKKKKQKSKRKR